MDFLLPTANEELLITTAVAFFVYEFFKPTAAVECELEQMNTFGLFDLVLVTAAAVTTAGGSVKLLLFELGWSELNVEQLWVANVGTLFFTLLVIAELFTGDDVSRSREADRKKLRALDISADANLLLVVSDSDLERDNSNFGI